ncbi:hypothetical protein CMUS01_06513 [Colletotrichum musicola]|uniref:Uncharacterized protein n=1 Tax=Colletotrichum musicola TaxID=2175873 RepID=A0A8H6KMM5_9PEZI|nr:hypothetical protein CMUS01_06513 [Colletotrichum musicola]
MRAPARRLPLRGPQQAVLRNTSRTSRFNGQLLGQFQRKRGERARQHNRRAYFGLRVALGAKDLAVLAAAERPRREERKASFLALGLPEFRNRKVTCPQQPTEPRLIEEVQSKRGGGALLLLLA